MVTRLKVAILLVLLPMYGVVQAAEWVSFGKDTSGKATSFIDMSSIEVSVDIRRAIVKTVIAPRMQHGTGGDSNKWVLSTVQRLAFNCAQSSLRDEAFTIYYEDGANQRAPAAAYPSPWRPVIPDTPEGRMAVFICAWQQT